MSGVKVIASIRPVSNTEAFLPCNGDEDARISVGFGKNGLRSVALTHPADPIPTGNAEPSLEDLHAIMTWKAPAPWSAGTSWLEASVYKRICRSGQEPYSFFVTGALSPKTVEQTYAFVREKSRAGNLPVRMREEIGRVQTRFLEETFALGLSCGISHEEIAGLAEKIPYNADPDAAIYGLFALVSLEIAKGLSHGMERMERDLFLPGDVATFPDEVGKAIVEGKIEFRTHQESHSSGVFHLGYYEPESNLVEMPAITWGTKTADVFTLMIHELTHAHQDIRRRAASTFEFELEAYVRSSAMMARIEERLGRRVNRSPGETSTVSSHFDKTMDLFKEEVSFALSGLTLYGSVSQAFSSMYIQSVLLDKVDGQIFRCNPGIGCWIVLPRNATPEMEKVFRRRLQGESVGEEAQLEAGNAVEAAHAAMRLAKHLPPGSRGRADNASEALTALGRALFFSHLANDPSTAFHFLSIDAEEIMDSILGELSVFDGV